MSFLAPQSAAATPPPPPPPPPNPPLFADPGVQLAGWQARRAAAAAEGGGFSGTLHTSPQGAGAPSTVEKELSGTQKNGAGKATFGG